MILKGGNTVAEGYYKPFEKSIKRRLYSCSKTIAALALGKLIGEGLARLDAPLVSYFPECTDPDPVMPEITLEDALTMTVPQTKGAYSADGPGPNDVVVYSDWTKVFFSGKNKSIKPHGRLFGYNSTASYVLGDLVKHLTGKDFLEYLRPELDKIGVSRNTNIGALSTVLEFYDEKVAIEMTPSAEAMLGEYKEIAIGKQI